MKVDLASLFETLRTAVADSSTPAAAWQAVVAAVDTTGYHVPARVRDVDTSAEVGRVASQLSAGLAEEPPPPGLSFYFFGLFDSWDPDAEREGAGFYFSGGSGEPEEVLAEGDLDYFPEARYLESDLLHAIKAAAPELGKEYLVFDYGLMFGAAGVLAKFAAREAGLSESLIVGFESGDFGCVT